MLADVEALQADMGMAGWRLIADLAPQRVGANQARGAPHEAIRKGKYQSEQGDRCDELDRTVSAYRQVYEG